MTIYNLSTELKSQIEAHSYFEKSGKLSDVIDGIYKKNRDGIGLCPIEGNKRHLAVVCYGNYCGIDGEYAGNKPLMIIPINEARYWSVIDSVINFDSILEQIGRENFKLLQEIDESGEYENDNPDDDINSYSTGVGCYYLQGGCEAAIESLCCWLDDWVETKLKELFNPEIE